MILSNIEIQKAIDEGRLIITPDPQPRDPGEPNCPYDTTAVDLHLGADLSIPQGGAFNYDLRQKGSFAKFLSRNCENVTILETGYPLEPNKFVLGITQERIALPLIPNQTLAARIEGKSSVARCGILVHFTAPTVHAGWDGPLALEMINLGPAGFTLFPGLAIAQLILELVSGDPNENPSQFQGQSKPAGTSNQ
ncbi:MAG: dCTP deaminase [Pyrinomonadaceae bacterium]|jgi:dCTP deaminase|nr:dCTP deaminase [Pyrinomonadaceae bacterium]